MGKRRASVRGEYHRRTESYGFGSTQTRRRTLSACKTFSTCGLRIHHPYVRVRAKRVPRTCRAEDVRVSTASLRIPYGGGTHHARMPYVCPRFARRQHAEAYGGL
ncbi:hypothetical protein Bbelb_395900 [Branchiostoma belcheri]|nr:hypothetical protein Bbelb_395900 [Branchiostoma belcheri]